MATAEPLSFLVLGHRGLLGRELMKSLPKLGAVSGVDRDECDIRHPEQIEKVLDAFRPRWVLNAAAYTDVDGCESNRELAWAINAVGPGNLARACRLRGIALAHLSTDFVFDGRKREPYTEEDVPRPLSAYGESKFGGEEEVRLRAGAHLIVRTAWLFGAGGKNFPDTILTRARASPVLPVVADQIGSPTYAVDLAEAIGGLIRRNANGIVHVANRGSCSWYEYARFILRSAGVKTMVRPIASRELDRPAERPAYSVLCLDRYERITGRRMRLWQKAVSAYLKGRAAEVEKSTEGRRL